MSAFCVAGTRPYSGYVKIELEEDVVDLHVRISTQNLTLSPIKEWDQTACVSLMTRPLAVDNLGNIPSFEKEQAVKKVNEWIRKWLDQNPFSALVVRSNTDHLVRGIVILGGGEEKGEVTLSCLFSESCGVNEYVQEALTAVAQHFVPLLRENKCILIINHVPSFPCKLTFLKERTDPYLEHVLGSLEMMKSKDVPGRYEMLIKA